MELCATGWDDYEVIDSGDGLRLERLGDVVVSRQCAQAWWQRSLPESEWNKRLWASHFRPDQGAGKWTYKRPVPSAWDLRTGDTVMEMRLTQFGHIGLFAEQQVQWRWLREQLSQRSQPVAMNLFGYTGGSTLAAAQAGADVTHVDAVKGIVSWARINAEKSGLANKPVRWMVDDALRFVQREARRERRYDAIILDPPTFGRGPKGQVWKIERDLVELLEACEAVLSPEPTLILLSAHTPGMTAAVLRNMMSPLVQKRGGRLESGDMVQKATESPCVLPSGVFCRWTPE